MTVVKNLKTGETYSYLLPPEEAVRFAYIQYEMSRWDTWNYANIETPDLQFGERTVSCSDFVATISL